jgi:hypothetical protein
MTNTTSPLVHDIFTSATGRASCACGQSFPTYGNEERSFAQHVADADAIASAKVGDFATYSIGSDRYPVEIIARTPKSFTTRGAEVIGSDTANAYEKGRPDTFVVVPNEHGQIRKFTVRRDGAIRSVGANYDRLSLGHVDTYRDPSF